MSIYTLDYEDKKIELNSTKCAAFFNDDEQPINGVDEALVINLLNEGNLVIFSPEYYDQRCEACGNNKKEGSKYYQFLEFHFYIFSKNGHYVMSSLSEDYVGKTLPQLLKKGSVDASYIASVNVCPECNDYTIDLEYGLF